MSLAQLRARASSCSGKSSNRVSLRPTRPDPRSLCREENSEMVAFEPTTTNNQGGATAAAVTNNECLSAISMSPMSNESIPVPLQSQRVSLDQSHSEQCCPSNSGAEHQQKTPSTVCSQSLEMNAVAKNDSGTMVQALTTAGPSDQFDFLQKVPRPSANFSSKPKRKPPSLPNSSVV